MKYQTILTLFALPIALSACSSSKDFHPTDAEISKLEKRLAKHRCVGDLKNWRRTYARMPIFTPEEVAAAKRENRMERLENFDKRMIEFKLERADGKSIIAGRVRPKSYDDLAFGACSEPVCLGGGFAIPRDQLFLGCEKRAAP